MLNPLGVIVLIMAIFGIGSFIYAVIDLVKTKIEQKRKRAMRVRLTQPRKEH